jgi:spore germination protein D
MLVLFLAVVLCTACGAEPSPASQMDYKEVKTMVIDILKTEEGMKAIDFAMNSTDNKDSMRMRILETGQGQELQTVVKDILSDPAYAHALKELMVDPKFAGDFAKAVNQENKQIHKALMKDPEYQQALIDTMKDPQFEKMLLETMKSSEYRLQVMAVMKESLQSPLFQAQLIELMQKALEEQAKPKPDEQKGGAEPEPKKKRDDKEEMM